MSYLSRRMREDGWPKRKPDDLTITLTFDTSRFDAAVARMCRAFKDLAERAGLALTPWQEATVEAMFADPDALRRMTVPPVAGRRWPPVLVEEVDRYFASSTPEPCSGAVLAEMVRAAGEIEEAPKLPEKIKLRYREWGTVEESDLWSAAAWPFVIDEVAGELRPTFKREYLGIWPTPRERE